MLHAFRVSNFKSIRDFVEIDLAPSGDPVSVAAVYGPNASGKSTIIDALQYVQRFVADSQANGKPDDSTGREPFLLNQHSRSEPSSFEIEFDVDGILHQFGFAVDNERVHQEWLYRFNTAKRTVLFERGIDERPWRFGPSLGGRNKVITDVTRRNALFLSAAAQLDHLTLTPVYRALAGTILYAPYNPRGAEQILGMLMSESERVQESIGNFLKSADTGVVAIHARKADDAGEFEKLFSSPAVNLDDSLPAADALRFKLEFDHRGEGGTYSLPFNSESLGTRALAFFALWATMALDMGRALVIDELDRSLHPILASSLIDAFRDPSRNKLGAQLIFTTHDVSLLGTDVNQTETLSRENVWLAEKDETGSTALTPLRAFSPRKELNLERSYLAGRFGAIPLVNTSIGKARSQVGE